MQSLKKCPLCSGQEQKEFYQGKDMYFSGQEVKFVVCPSCSLVFLNPRPDQDEYREMYRSVFQDKRRKIETLEQAVNRLQTIKSYERKIKELKYFKGFINQDSYCLEIGAGWGTLAKVIQDYIKCKVDCIEPSILAAKTAREYYGLNVFCGDFDGFFNQNQKRYNFVFAYHVFEHISTPNDFLQKVRKILAADGKFLLAIPDITNPDLPLEQFFHIEHCFYYSPRTLELMLNKNGFKVIKQWRCRRDLKVICEKGPKREISIGINSEEYKKFKVVLRSYQRRYKILRFFKNIIYRFLNKRQQKKISRLTAAFFKKIRFIKS